MPLRPTFTAPPSALGSQTKTAPADRACCSIKVCDDSDPSTSTRGDGTAAST
jgi:hypothetical protein